jgi:type I restriction enzyme R subunit
METPSFKEDHISQIPTLQLLMKLGYTYLSPVEAERMRGNKCINVLLEEIIRKQLKEINRLTKLTLLNISEKYNSIN